jgi:hypothetical protein
LTYGGTVSGYLRESKEGKRCLEEPTSGCEVEAVLWVCATGRGDGAMRRRRVDSEALKAYHVTLSQTFK